MVFPALWNGDVADWVRLEILLSVTTKIQHQCDTCFEALAALISFLNLKVRVGERSAAVLDPLPVP